jgi:hypothetical protein
MKYEQLKFQKSLIEKHIAFLKQQYMDALMSDLEWHHEMSKANEDLRKVNKLLNS